MTSVYCLGFPRMTRENTSVRREKSGLAGLGADKNSRILVRRSYVRLSRAWEISGSVNAYVKHHFEYETVSEPKQLGVALCSLTRSGQVGENGNQPVELYNDNAAAERG